MAETQTPTIPQPPKGAVIPPPPSGAKSVDAIPAPPKGAVIPPPPKGATQTVPPVAKTPAPPKSIDQTTFVDLPDNAVVTSSVSFPKVSKNTHDALSVIPMKFNLSGASRTHEKNKQVGGVEDSMHLSGNAVDIKADSDGLNVYDWIKTPEGKTWLKNNNAEVYLEKGNKMVDVYDLADHIHIEFNHGNQPPPPPLKNVSQGTSPIQLPPNPAQYQFSTETPGGQPISEKLNVGATPVNLIKDAGTLGKGLVNSISHMGGNTFDFFADAVVEPILDVTGNHDKIAGYTEWKAAKNQEPIESTPNERGEEGITPTSVLYGIGGMVPVVSSFAVGGGAIAQGGRLAGMGQQASQAFGTIMAGFPLFYQDNLNEAKNAMPDASVLEQNIYATTATGLMGVIFSQMPAITQIKGIGNSLAKIGSKSFAESIASGASSKIATNKAASSIIAGVKNIALNSGVMTANEVSNGLLKMANNTVGGSQFEVDLDPKTILNNFVANSLINIPFGIHAGLAKMNKGNYLQAGTTVYAAKNPASIHAELEKMRSEGKITEEQFNASVADLDKLSGAYNKIAEGTPDDVAAQITPLIAIKTEQEKLLTEFKAKRETLDDTQHEIIDAHIKQVETNIKDLSAQIKEIQTPKVEVPKEAEINTDIIGNKFLEQEKADLEKQVNAADAKDYPNITAASKKQLDRLNENPKKYLEEELEYYQNYKVKEDSAFNEKELADKIAEIKSSIEELNTQSAKIKEVVSKTTEKTDTKTEPVEDVSTSPKEEVEAGSVGVVDNPALKNETPILSTPKRLSTEGLPDLEIVASKEASEALEAEIGGDKGVINENVRTIPIQEYDVPSNRRSKQISEQIEENGWIEPLIVSYDKNGQVYIVEGQHRAAALKELGYDKAPVIVIHEKDLGKKSQETTKAGTKKVEAPIPDVPLVENEKLSSTENTTKAINELQPSELYTLKKKIAEIFEYTRGFTDKQIDQAIIPEKVSNYYHKVKSDKTNPIVKAVEQSLKETPKAETKKVEAPIPDVPLVEPFKPKGIKQPSVLYSEEQADGWLNGAIRNETGQKRLDRLDELEVVVNKSRASDSDKKYSIDAINREREKLSKPTSQKSDVPLEGEKNVISDVEYNAFIDKGTVTPERLNLIADKIKGQEKLSDREKDIFTDKTSEINKILKGEKENTKSGKEQPVKPNTEKTPIQAQREKVKASRKAVKDSYKNLGIDPLEQSKDRARKLMAYHKDLVGLARLHIKEFGKDIHEFADALGSKVTRAIKKAWDEATGVIKPIKSSIQLKYDDRTADRVVPQTKGQKTINEATGVTKPKNKVVVDEKTALKNQIRIEANSAKKVYKQAIDDVRNLPKKLTDEQRKRANAHLKDFAKEQARHEKEMQRLSDKAASFSNAEGYLAAQMHEGKKHQQEIDRINKKHSAQLDSASKKGFALAKKKAKIFADIIKDKLNSKEWKGKLSDSQVTAIVNRAAHVGTSDIRLNDFLEYANKVIEDANYSQKVETGNELLKVAKKLSKNKDLPVFNKQTIAALRTLPIEKITDIDTFNDMLASMTKELRGKQKGRKYSQEDINTFIEKESELITKNEDARLTAELNEYKKAGDTPESTTLEEYKSMLEDLDMYEAEGKISAPFKEKLIEKIREDIPGLKNEVITERSLNQVSTPESPLQKKVIDILLGIDHNTADAKTLKQLNTVLHNYIESGTLGGVKDLVANKVAADRLNEAKSLPAKLLKMKQLITKSGLFNNFVGRKTLPNILRELTYSKDAAAGIHQLTVSELKKVYANAEENTNIFTNKLSTIFEKNKMDDRNNLRIGVYSFISQFEGRTGADGKPMTFEGMKERVLADAERMIEESKSYTKKWVGDRTAKDLLEEAKHLKEIISEFGDAKTPEEAFAKLSQGEKQIYSISKTHFEENVDRFKEMMEIAENKKMGLIKDYIPLEAYKFGEKEQKDLALDENEFTSSYVNRNPVGSTIERQPLSHESLYNYKFMEVVRKSAFQHDFYSHGQLELSILSKILNSKEFKDIINETNNTKRNLQNFETIASSSKERPGAIIKVVNEWKNSGDIPAPPETIIEYVLDKIRKTLIHSPEQIIKQSSPNLIQTILSEGGGTSFHASLTTRFGTPEQLAARKKLLTKFSGKIAAGLGEYEIEHGLFKNDVAGFKSEVFRKARRLKEKSLVFGIGESLFKKGDRLGRSDSFLAAYIHSLIKQGEIKNAREFDIVKEAESPNKKAIAYAEISAPSIVNISTQAERASNIKKSLEGGFFTKQGYKLLSFGLNARESAKTSLRIVFDSRSTKSEKQEAFRDFSAYTAQVASFAVISSYLSSVLYGNLADGIAYLMGYSTDDDTDEKEAEKQKARIGARIVSDFAFGSQNIFGQAAGQAAMNWVSSKVASAVVEHPYSKENKGSIRDKNFVPFYGNDKPVLGVAEIPASMVQDVTDIAKDMYGDNPSDAEKAKVYAWLLSVKATSLLLGSGMLYNLSNKLTGKVRKSNTGTTLANPYPVQNLH